MNNNDEYLRRNEIVAMAAGARSGAVRVLHRVLKAHKSYPQWLVKELSAMVERLDELPDHMTKWRDAAHHE